MLFTERLLLRLLQEADAPELLRFYSENSEHLHPWIPTLPPEAGGEEYWLQRIQIAAEGFCEGRSARFGVFSQNRPERLIGQVNLNDIIRGSAQLASIGYHIAKEAEGKGYVTEAIREVIRFGFEELNLHRVTADYMPRNARSAAVLQRLGFVQEGLSKEFLLINGVWEDHVRTCLINPKWRPPKP